MKKIIVICFILLVGSSLLKLETKNEREKDVPKEEIRSIYISYIELHDSLAGRSEEEAKKNIREMVENVKKDHFNWIFLHVRSFSDSLYPSSVFPTDYMINREEGKPFEFDALAYFIEQAHQNNIQIHAWINPFRIRNDTKTSTISIKNPCFKWFGTNHVKVIANKGIYYNPASEEVQKLILLGIQEVLDHYNVDGIHFDDYFYPDDTIDEDNYQLYLENGGKLSLPEYHLEIINHFVRDVYQLVKKKNPALLFGIAPDGNIENNYHKNYADVRRWMEEDGYIDYIMPQLYYGFQNETKPYASTLNDWNALVKKENLLFLPALAFYKTGEVDTYAKSGSKEWQNHDNIIANQIKFARYMEHYNGFTLFRYGNLYDEKSEIRTREYQNFQNLLSK